ncbi:1,4-dihydroxy-2-naphthoate polyprenyltransferase [Vibrio ulleungensis]|uniref:1,4-dihydroxy-2-naphthoate octaprenyltransferase n=1 Tax=Vibrio ulleungensis TaxID=2807619 RepID=A0ABS2HNY5_9VIBR|nr:1,4-dihydroxy-2-naphthoate polyprenyltransferase [Vibrio ulleungensis]MBM7037769.1 1,4-dihydroxy-2-naphthoate polyprenyltransferase [Vibrio ulleungensis]
MNTIPIQAWIGATRPKTLPLALCSILLGSTLAYTNGSLSISTLVLAIVTASLLQILSNLANDYGDAVKGTDNEQRIGPTRAVQSGDISLPTMKKALWVTSLLTLVSGLALVMMSVNTPTQIVLFLGLGISSMLAAVAYTVGKRPYGYLGLGDLAVLLFFGFVGVIGSEILHTGVFTLLSLIPAAACGLLSVAVLNINNMRDIDNDEASGKHTVPVRIGLQSAKQYHLILCGLAWALFACYLVFIDASILSIAIYSIALAPIAVHCGKIKECDYPSQVAPLMGDVVKTALLVNVVFIVALLVN